MRAYHLLAVVPTAGLLAGLPFANRLEPMVLGLPFLLFCIVAWILVTAAVMALIYALDRAHGIAGAAAEPLSGERASGS